MISIAPPPVPVVSRPRRSPALEFAAAAFFGRSFAEYLQIFDLDPAVLRKRPVLDVAGGPASFTAEACRLGIDAVAVDPMYGLKPDALATQVRLDYPRMHQRMREHPERFRLAQLRPANRSNSEPRARVEPRFPSLEVAIRDRAAAAQRFLEDYAAHVAHGRYFGAALPYLPFLDGTFDLVLCGHLLFLHQQQFDFSFHVAACRELVRVSRHDVRIHPLCGPDGRRYPELDRLLEELSDNGIEAKILQLTHEFFVGADQTLVLTRKSS